MHLTLKNRQVAENITETKGDKSRFLRKIPLILQ